MRTDRYINRILGVAMIGSLMLNCPGPTWAQRPLTLSELPFTAQATTVVYDPRDGHLSINGGGELIRVIEIRSATDDLPGWNCGDDRPPDVVYLRCRPGAGSLLWGFVFEGFDAADFGTIYSVGLSPGEVVQNLTIDGAFVPSGGLDAFVDTSPHLFVLPAEIDTDGDGLLDVLDVPGFDPAFLETFDYRYAGVQDLDGANLLTNVRTLNLSSNRITSVDRGDLAGLVNLQSLDLSKNPITSIESGAFIGMQSLRTLRLADQLEEVDFSQADFRDLGNNCCNGVSFGSPGRLILDDANLTELSFNAIVSKLQSPSITEVSLVGLRFTDASPSNLSALLNIDSLERVHVDQSLFDQFRPELSAFAATAANTLDIIGYGDANKDGEFNSNDLVSVFVAGEYEDSIDGNSYWTEGDWNSDGDFDSADLVSAFATGTYEQGQMNAVPEPHALAIALVGLALLLPKRRANLELFCGVQRTNGISRGDLK